LKNGETIRVGQTAEKRNYIKRPKKVGKKEGGREGARKPVNLGARRCM